MVKLHVELIPRRDELIEIPQRFPRMPELNLHLIENRKRVKPECLSDESGDEKKPKKGAPTMTIRRKQIPPMNIDFPGEPAQYDRFPRSASADKPAYRSPAMSNSGNVDDLHRKLSPTGARSPVGSYRSPFNDPLMVESPRSLRGGEYPRSPRGGDPSERDRSPSPLHDKAHLLKSPLFRKPFPRDRLPKNNYDSEDSIDTPRFRSIDSRHRDDDPPRKRDDPHRKHDDYSDDERDRHHRRDDDDYRRDRDDDRSRRDRDDDYHKRDRSRHDRDDDDYDKRDRDRGDDKRDRDDDRVVTDKRGEKIIMIDSDSEPDPIDSPPPRGSDPEHGEPNNPYRKAGSPGPTTSRQSSSRAPANISQDKINEYLEKYEILRITYPEENLPQLHAFMDPTHIINTYEQQFKRVTMMANLNEYKMYLMIMFLAVEYGLKYTFDVDMYGFVKQQLKFSHKYDKLLLQLGEREYMSFGDNWPAEVKIVVMFGFHIIIFFASKQIGKKFGQGASDTIQDVLVNVGNVTDAGNISANPMAGLFNMFMGGNIRPAAAPAPGTHAPPAEKKTMRGPTVDLDDI